MVAMLDVSGLQKTYFKSRLNRTPTFELAADFRIEQPAIVGMMGPNGSGAGQEYPWRAHGST